MEILLKYLPLMNFVLLGVMVWLGRGILRFITLETNVKTIMENHLPHLDARLESIEKDIRLIYERLIQ